MSGGWFAAELRAHDVELHTIDALWLSAEAATIAIECSTKRAKKNSIWFEMANCIAECLQEMKSRENDYHLFFLKIAMVFFVEVIASHGITIKHLKCDRHRQRHQHHNYSKFVRN